VLKKTCPQCRRISPESTTRCPECGYDLTAVVPAPPGPQRLQCRCNFTFGEVAGQALTWLLLAVVTGGIALFFYPYYWARFVLQHTTWSED
jgi:hypothetical protein